MKSKWFEHQKIKFNLEAVPEMYFTTGNSP